MVQGYHSGSYLQPLIKEAKTVREQNKDICKLTKLERRLSDAFNIDVEGCIKTIKALMNNENMPDGVPDNNYIRGAQNK